MSQGAIDLSGSNITPRWAALPKTLSSYYGSNFCQPNAPWPGQQVIDDCINASGVQNSLDTYYGVIVVVNYSALFQGLTTIRDTGSGPRVFGEAIYGPGLVPCTGGRPSTPPGWPPMGGVNGGHEMGHSLGLSHAHSLHLDGTFDEYGDGWDIMGGGQ